MNRDQIKKVEGSLVRLRPEALDDRRRPVDDDWLVTTILPEGVQLTNQRTGQRVTLGFDHVHSFMSDPNRSDSQTRYGFFELHVEVRLGPGGVQVEPLPGPRSAGRAESVDVMQFEPLVLQEAGVDRYFSWRGRGPVHLIDREDEPRQLMEFFKPLCDALRRETDMEPQFDDPRDIRGEIVFELTPDGRAKSRLLGGMAGAAGRAVLVLRSKGRRR